MGLHCRPNRLCRSASEYQTISHIIFFAHNGLPRRSTLRWRWSGLCLLIGFLACASLSGCSSEQTETASPESAVEWTSGSGADTRVTLYFFWTRTCSHCKRARPAIERLRAELSWLDVRDVELKDRAAGQRFATIAHSVGGSARSVPAFVFCGRMLTGYDSAIDSELREALHTCLREAQDAPEPDPKPKTITAEPATGQTGERPSKLPGFLDENNSSLLAITTVLALLDSFNPCAFFVLLFLLSLMVNARSRARMILIGTLFIAVSGLSYFVFMSAWLNLFLFTGELQLVTLVAGALAVLIGALNTKDAFGIKRGPSLAISDQARPDLYRRVRGLLQAERLSLLVLGTLTLAVVANAYELLCTAGFPMVFSRMLTLRDLSTGTYYGWLALYCLIYVVPLLIIVGVFAFTLGRRKLSAKEGATLKLVSGLMMVQLGALLLFRPALLNDLRIAVLLPVIAVLLSVIISRWLGNPKPA